MRSFHGLFGIGFTFLVLSTPKGAFSQDPGSPIPSVEQAGQAKEVASGKGYLEQRFGLSKQEAASRLERQESAEAFAISLAEKYPSAFLGLEIQHEPQYEIVISVGSDEFDASIRQDVPPQLRAFLRTRKSRFDRAQVDSTRREIISSLEGVRFALSFDYTRDRYVITAPRSSHNDIRAKLPASASPFVQFRDGEVATPVQSNATSADSLYAGWSNLGSTGNHCTFAFTARDSSGTQSQLTAEHCQSSVTETRTNDENSKVMTFAQQGSTAYRRYAYDSSLRRTYDFRLIPAPVVKSGPSLWFVNPKTNVYQKATTDQTQPQGWRTDTISYTNNYAGLPSSGYLTITGSVSSGTTTGPYNPGHPVGAVRCKSGRTSGTTCGLITNSSYYGAYNTDNVLIDGMVEVSQSNQPVIAAAGDSGGPIFDEPRWNSTYSRYEAKAAGIMHAANLKQINPVFPTAGKRPCDSRYDQDPCAFVYMPLDRVNDYGPVTISVMSGSSPTFIAP